VKSLRAALVCFLALCASFGGVQSGHIDVSGARAADCSIVACNALAAAVSTTPTIYVNASWPKTGGGSWCCGTIIRPGLFNRATIINHGGSGDEFTNGRQFQVISLSTVTYNITGATWSSTFNSIANGGATTFTLDADPTAGTYGPIVTVGNTFQVTGVVSTGGSGAGFNSPAGSPWTVLAVNGPAKTVTVAQTAASSPGTYSSGGVATAQTVVPTSVINAYVNLYGGSVIILTQGLSPVGGTDNANTASFSGSIATSGGVSTLTAAAPSVGVITLSQILSSAHVTDSPGISSQGTGAGWAGTYVLSKNEGTVASEAMTSTGCPIAPNNTTWSNWNSTSCRNDAAMMDDLSKALQSNTPGTGAFATPYNLPATSVDCIGHSEGAGLCMRLAWEYGADFGHVGGVSMPFSYYYAAAGGNHTALPSTMVPIWMMTGGKDCVVVDDVADCPGGGGTVNSMHATISNGSGGAGTALVVQAVDSGAVTAGNQITTGALPGTYITACSDGTHCTVYPSQSVLTSTSMRMNNLYSATIQNNSNNRSKANLADPAYTTWINYVNSMATWANGYSLHGCPAGYGSQLPVSGAAVTAVTVGNLLKWTPCSGYLELDVVTDADHTMKLITGNLGGNPPWVRYEKWGHDHQ